MATYDFYGVLGSELQSSCLHGKLALQPLNLFLWTFYCFNFCIQIYDLFWFILVCHVWSEYKFISSGTIIWTNWSFLQMPCSFFSLVGYRPIDLFLMYNIMEVPFFLVACWPPVHEDKGQKPHQRALDVLWHDRDCSLRDDFSELTQLSSRVRGNIKDEFSGWGNT